MGTGGTALKVDSRTDLIYLARRGTGEIAIYDPFSFLPIDSYRTGGDAAYLTIDGEGNNLCAVLPGRTRVADGPPRRQGNGIGDRGGRGSLLGDADGGKVTARSCDGENVPPSALPNWR